MCLWLSNETQSQILCGLWETKTMNPTWYLAQPYTHHPQGQYAAFQQAVEWTDQLERIYDLSIYSPIVASHPLWQHIQENNFPPPTHEYWLRKDLEKIEGLMNHDGKVKWEYKNSYCKCGESIDWQYHSNDIFHCKCGITNNRKIINYDSGIVILMDENAIKWPCKQIKALNEAYNLQKWGVKLSVVETNFTPSSHLEYKQSETIVKNYEWKELWNSTGCKIEYEYAKGHYIRILSLQKLFYILKQIRGRKSLNAILRIAKEQKIEVEL